MINRTLHRRFTSKRYCRNYLVSSAAIFTVFAGIFKSDRRPVAIKTFSALSGTETRKMLLNEAKTLLAVAHEHVIKLLGVVSYKNEIATTRKQSV